MLLPEPAPPPPPRSVPRGAISWNAGFGLLFGGAFGAAGTLVVLVLFLVGGPPWNDAILDYRAEPAVGTPLSVSGTGSSVNEVDVMRISFQFADSRGRPFVASTSTTAGPLIEQARARQPLTIEYDPEDPSRARIVGEKSSFIPPALYLLGLMGIIGFAIFVPSALSAVRTRHIYRHGIAVGGQVVRHESTGSEQNGQTVISMEYQFQHARGVAQGAWKTVRPAPVGGALWILHLPDRPDRNVPAVGWRTTIAQAVDTPKSPSPPATGTPRIWS